jgi:hypothetical protein
LDGNELARSGVRDMDSGSVAVVLVLVVAYVVGSLTSSVETETKLPHYYR